MAACSDDDDDDGGSQSTNPNDPGGPGGPGGPGDPGDPGDPGTPALSGNIIITPTAANINTQLTATYSGSEAVSYQWNRNGAPISGAVGTSYVILDYGSYTVTVSAPNYLSKTSAAVTVSGGGQAQEVPGFSRSGILRVTEDLPIKFVDSTYTGAMIPGGNPITGPFERIPKARYINITSTEVITNLTIDIQGNNYFVIDYKMDANQQIENPSVVLPRNPPLLGEPTSITVGPGAPLQIAVQPSQYLNARPYYDVITVTYPARSDDMLLIPVTFDLAKGTGMAVADDAIPLTYEKTNSTTITVKNDVPTGSVVTGDLHGTSLQPLEYAISTVFSDNPLAPPAGLVWINSGQTYDLTASPPANTTTPTTGPGNVVFTGLTPNWPYWVYVRYEETVNYNAGPIKVIPFKAPLSVNTTP